MRVRSSPAPCCSRTYGTITSIRRRTSSTFTSRASGPRSTRISRSPCCTRSAAPVTASVTALTKLLRTTTFRLSLTYLAFFGAAAVVAISYIYWNTTVLLTQQLHETIDAELKGLAEQYTAGGLNRLVSTIADRSRTPGSSLYYVADAEGRRIVGNLGGISSELANSRGPVEFVYSRPAEGGTERRLGFANVFRLPGGYRLIVGRDIEE